MTYVLVILTGALSGSALAGTDYLPNGVKTTVAYFIGIIQVIITLSIIEFV